MILFQCGKISFQEEMVLNMKLTLIRILLFGVKIPLETEPKDGNKASLVSK